MSPYRPRLPRSEVAIWAGFLAGYLAYLLNVWIALAAR